MASRVNVRWVVHTELSVAQAAYVVATGADCVDPKTEQLLVESVTGINTRLISASIDVAEFWQQYRSAIAAGENCQSGCAAALITAGCSEFQVEQTGKAIFSLLSECRIEFSRRFPKLSDQLELRGRPLKERWDTVGTGLLNDVLGRIWGEHQPEGWWPTRVDGLLIQPIRGGDGGFQSSANTFWIEAMLTDADPAVPEVLRIACLLTQMAIQKQMSDLEPDSPLGRAWNLAAVPVVLAAGAELEVLRAPALPVRQALALWLAADDSVSGKVDFWWQQHGATGTSLPVAIKELARLLDSNQPGTDAPSDG